MAEELVERRLAAILAADVVGYTRLMEANEEHTLAVLRQHRRDFLDPAVARHGGRIFKVMGDGFLVEFASVISATRCALEIQRGMPDRNSGLPEDRHFRFRIGINLGDIIVDGDDFQGDGVNMAVRLQGLAAPGGIACSAAVHHEVGNKLDLDFIDRGETQVKNMHSVRVYSANLETAARREETVSRQAGLVASEPLRPSVAILPFANLSNDPEQEFFSDGITEDIITDLSKVSGLFVLSRNTVFTYKRRAQTIARIARELGVAYVVEGSVRKSGNRVRINAELTEGFSDGHVWAERYDRDLTDIFAVQDEIAKAIVKQLRVKLLPEEKRAIEQPQTANVDAYTHYLRGREYYHIANRACHIMARHAFMRALELDPGYARAIACVAICDIRLQTIYSSGMKLEDIIARIETALAIEPDLAEAHAVRGFVLALAGRQGEALDAFERAFVANPDCHEAHRFYAEHCITSSRFDLAARHFVRASEIKPTDYGGALMAVAAFRSLGDEESARKYAVIAIHKAEDELRAHPENANCACLGATVLAYLGERDRAIEWLDRSIFTDPGDVNVQYNAACTYALLGEVERALDLLEGWVPLVGPVMRRWFRNDSDLEGLRAHPRYQRLLDLTNT